MSKKYFIELSEFNIWANDRVCSWLDKISDEQWKQPLVSSFNSIYETYYMWQMPKKYGQKGCKKNQIQKCFSQLLQGQKQICWELERTVKEF